jgi:hypothetical protein
MKTSIKNNINRNVRSKSFLHNGVTILKGVSHNPHQNCKIVSPNGPVVTQVPKLSRRYLSNNNYKRKLINKIDRNLDKFGTIKKIPKVFITLLQDYVSLLDLTYPIEEIITQVVDLHNQLIRDHGIKDGTKRFNTIRLYVINILEGNGNVENPPFMAVSQKFKFPSKLYKMLTLYTNVVNNRCEISDRTIRSIFYINRLVADYSEIDLTNVVKVHNVPEKFLLDFRYYIRQWKVDSKYQHSPDLITEPTEKFVRNGPNGEPKFKTADIEAIAIYKSKLWKPFMDICNLTGNQNLSNFVFELQKNNNKKLSKEKIEKIRLRYITSIKDKANKARLVAISDYWTQIALFPLMNDVKYLTEKHFNKFSSSKSHAEGFERLKKSIKVGIKSYDITSWTDAFPSSLQKIMLEELYSFELAQSWYDLVVTCDWEVKGRKGTVKYGTGQGMGTAGSFDIAMLTDMFVLSFIYKRDYNINIFKFRDAGNLLFNKVGDDLWCYDPKMKIHHCYTKELGMEINESKTKQSTSENLCGEYVSRNLNYGKDVSRISANICRAISKNVLDIPELARHLEERNINYFPIRKILKSCKLTTYDDQLRSFYLLTLFFPLREGMKTLKYSIRKDFLNFITGDPILSLLSKKDIETLKNSFLITEICLLLPLIQERMKHLFQNVALVGYECSIDMIADNTRGNSFKYRNDKDLDENLELITSKWIYAKCMRLVNSLPFVLEQRPSQLDTEIKKILGPMVTKSSEMEQKVVQMYQLETVFDRLSSILQGLTFKELGKIESDKKPYRPTTTKLFNFVKTLRPIEVEPHLGEDGIWSIVEHKTPERQLLLKQGAALLGGKFVPKNGTSPLIGVSFYHKES